MNQFKQLSDVELENSFQKWVRHEREVLHKILEHICEVSKRELHLARGYSSLKDYLVENYGYSERAAYRRIDGAKLLVQVPILSEKIKMGTMDITKIAEITRAVKEKERVTQNKVPQQLKAELVEKVAGKSSFESHREIAHTLDIEVKTTERKVIQKDESVRLELTLTKAQYDQLMKCRDLAAHKLQQEHLGFSMTAVIALLADQFLADSKISLAETKKAAKMETGVRSYNKTLTPKTKSLILKRDQCCQFRDPVTGKTCGSTFALHVDHLQPRWAGGKHDEGNLQILCGNHNRYKYRREAQLRFV